MRHFSYLNSAKRVIETYQGQEPLAIYLKQFFAQNKQMGGKDRKQIAALVYNYYRLGHSPNDVAIDDKILTATFLCSTQSNFVLQNLKPTWDEQIGLPLAEKIKMIQPTVLLNYIFPFTDELSAEIEAAHFQLSFLQQPKLFLRIRPGKQKQVVQKLSDGFIHFERIDEHCIALANGTKIEDVLVVNKEVVVQDYNSQQVGKYFQFANKASVYDACAASGGKSIMAFDANNSIKLSVSDVRESILINLRKRCGDAGINLYHSFLADLSKPSDNTEKYDYIIADVPCTGSGTWSRTPEQSFFFNPSTIEDFVARQKTICLQLIAKLNSGGSLIYITCSVFKKENEEVIAFLQAKFGLKVEHQELLKGYDKGADSMFVCQLKMENGK
jgi:16S rRNA (cytosine967-C5)-methyltransferase